MQFSFSARGKRTGQMGVGSGIVLGRGIVQSLSRYEPARAACRDSDRKSGLDATDVRGEIGIRTDKSFALADGILALRSRVASAHDHDPDRSIAATFQSLLCASFVVNGAASVVNARLTIKFKLDLAANSIFRIVR